MLMVSVVMLTAWAEWGGFLSLYWSALQPVSTFQQIYEVCQDVAERLDQVSVTCEYKKVTNKHHNNKYLDVKVFF